MKRFLFLLLLLLPCIGQAATATPPVVDLGTLTFIVDPPTAWTFSVTNHASGTITQSGTGANWTGGNYTPFNLTGMQNLGHARYVYVKINGQNPTELDDSNCGKLAITGMSVYYNNASYYLKRQLNKTKGNNPSLASPYTGGFYIAFTATVTPYANKGTCTLTQSLPSWFSYVESSSAWNKVNDADFIPVNLTFSITLITQGTSVEHDANAALNFGTFCLSSQTQTLTLSPSGSVTGSSMVCPPSADLSADSFTFKSSQASTFSVGVPSSPVNLTNAVTGDTLQVTNFTPSCSTSCTLLNNTATITVGGTLTVPGSSPVGEYTGAYPVSITY